MIDWLSKKLIVWTRKLGGDAFELIEDMRKEGMPDYKCDEYKRFLLEHIQQQNIR